MLPWQRHIRQLNHQKPKFVMLTCLLPFLASKGSRVLEKKVNEHGYQKLCSATLNSCASVNNQLAKFMTEVNVYNKI